MTVSVPKFSFVGGEWAPSLYGRTDLAKFNTAQRKMLNTFCHPHGGFSNRGGTQFIAEVKTSSKFTRVIAFTFSTTQAYVLEFGHLYMRVFKDGGVVGGPYELTTPYVEADLKLLKFTQSADVLKVTHPKYKPREISRTGHTAWTIVVISFGASLTMGNISRPGGTATGLDMAVTAVNEEGEESLYKYKPDQGLGNTIEWDAVTGAAYYNIYQNDRPPLGGVPTSFGWVGQAKGEGSNAVQFYIPLTPILPDFSRIPIKDNVSPFDSTDNYPGVSTFFEQRWIPARTNNDPQAFWGSVIAAFKNLNRVYPLKDDSAYKFVINARQVNEIKAMVPLDVLLLFTSDGEWKVSGGSGIGSPITPSSVSVKRISSWGISDLEPLVVGNAVLFVEESGSIVRDMQFQFEVGDYSGSNISVMANHFFTDYTIMDWCYQQYPDSIIWAIRDDGKIVGLTYFKEHKVWGWHLHETDGVFESITSVVNAEGVDEVYVVVQRTINGATKRYVEIFKPRLLSNIDKVKLVEDAWCVDSGLSLDNWNIDKTKIMRVSGGVTWAAGESMTLNTSGHTPFSPGSVGKIYRVRYVNPLALTEIKSVDMEITAYSTTSSVTAKPINRAVPEELRNVYSYRWALTVTSISGLGHLEAKEVAILADGNVVKGLTVSGGALTLPNPTAKVVVGLGYVSDVETFDFLFQGETGAISDRPRDIKAVSFELDNTRALWAGPDENNLDEMKFRDQEEYGDPIELFSGKKEMYIESNSDELKARIFIRNVDPLPITVLALTAKVEHGED